MSEAQQKKIIRSMIEHQFKMWRDVCMKAETQYDRTVYSLESELLGMLQVASVCGAITNEEWNDVLDCVNVIDWVNTYKGLTA